MGFVDFDFYISKFEFAVLITYRRNVWANVLYLLYDIDLPNFSSTLFSNYVKLDMSFDVCFYNGIARFHFFPRLVWLINFITFKCNVSPALMHQTWMKIEKKRDLLNNNLLFNTFILMINFEYIVYRIFEVLFHSYLQLD